MTRTLITALTLVLLSGAETPPTVSLLPETHVAVVSRARPVLFPVSVMLG